MLLAVALQVLGELAAFAAVGELWSNASDRIRLVFAWTVDVLFVPVMGTLVASPPRVYVLWCALALLSAMLTYWAVFTSSRADQFLKKEE